MRYSSLLACTALTLIATTGLAQADDVTAWRLFVADHAEAKVTAIDLGTDATLDTFALESPGVLYTTPSNQAVYAVEGAANRVSAIRTGIEIEDHGDHGDIHVTAPETIAATVPGEKPVHFVEHHGQIALFYDGEGVARLVSEKDWLDGNDTLAIREIATNAPHHGVAIPWGDHVIATDFAPNGETTRPQGVFVYDADNAKLGDLHECPLLHGEATSGNITAIACATGLLIVTGSGEPAITHLPYAESLPEGSVSTLLGGVGLQYFLGNYGADKIVLIDPAEADAFRLVELPTRRVHFAIDPQQPKFAYIFTEDGKLHQLNVLSGKIAKSITLTEPYSMDGEWSLPRPRIAVAGGEIAVTDPLKGLVHIVDAASFELDRDIEVAGLPYNIVAAGGSGATH